MTRLREWLATAALFGLVACTSSPATDHSPPPSPLINKGTHSAGATLARLCKGISEPTPSPEPAGKVPGAIRQVEGQVEAVRGLTYVRPVPVDAVTHDELVRRLGAAVERSSPDALLSRVSRVWQTIGAIPRDIGLKEALDNYRSSQVIGFYDPATGALVFQGSETPSPYERVTLAHELTHAIDDQHFDLSRLNDLEKHCRDEELQAASGAVEGSAQYFSFAVARQFLTEAEKAQLVQDVPNTPTTGIPPFVLRLQIWPYNAGLQFISSLASAGGLGAVNDALQNLPISTEQVIHPDKYPTDVPTPLDIPDLGPRLGKSWRDLDVEEIGEEWLTALLGLRMDEALEAQPAAAGWDGGLYRAWTDGDHVAVVLRTAWDSENDAEEFGDAMLDWINDGQPAEVASVGNQRVDVIFASDRPTLTALERALGS